MGGYFSKDYYTNEETIVQSDECNTTPKFRILKEDPRSATLGIVRTPIQVEATPKRPLLQVFTAPPEITSTTDPSEDCVGEEDSVATNQKNIEEQPKIENVCTSESNIKFDEEQEKPEINEGKLIIKSEPLVCRYLETNLDDFITSPLCDSVLVNEKAKELENQSCTEVNGAEMSSVYPCTVHTTTLLDVSDFIDAPSAIVRDNNDSIITGSSEAMNISVNTWQVENEMSRSSLSKDANGAEMSSVSPCTVHTTTLLDVSDFIDDPSAIVTDNDDSIIAGNSETMNISVNTWLEQVENEMNHCSLSEDVTPWKSIDNLVLQTNVTAANKKLFLTPDAKASSSPVKARTPLQDVKKNLLVDSPALVIKRKQWRCIQEERVKRGLLLDDENTPPPMPPFSNVPTSAPGKMMHKRHTAEWDKDSTVFI